MNRIINYSIIIPHKNIPKLLQRCLDSIPRREDVQIIVVDDNSDPNIVDFDNFPGLTDPHIEIVFTKEGKGAGFARNTGLTKAAGKWLLFVDADDYYTYCMNDMLDQYVDSDTSIVYFKFHSVDCELYTARNRCATFNKFIDYQLDAKKYSDKFLRYRHATVLSKLFKIELIKNNGILFDEVSISNDVTFAYLAGFYAASITVDPHALYCTTTRSDSIRHKKKNSQSKLDELYVVCKRYLFLKRNNIRVSSNIFRVNSLIISYFRDKSFYKKGVDLLKNIGFKKNDVIKLYLYCIFIFSPKIILQKIISRIKSRNK